MRSFYRTSRRELKLAANNPQIECNKPHDARARGEKRGGANRQATLLIGIPTLRLRGAYFAVPTHPRVVSGPRLKQCPEAKEGIDRESRCAIRPQPK